MTTVPKLLIFAMAAWPSSACPLWHAMMAAILLPEPSGAVQQAATIIRSSGAVIVMSRQARRTLPRFRKGKRHEAADHHRPDRMKAELERCRDAEISAAAAHRPEEIGMVVCTGADDRSVGEHKVHRQEVVERHAVICPSASRGRRRASDPATPVVPTTPPVVARPCS